MKIIKIKNSQVSFRRTGAKNQYICTRIYHYMNDLTLLTTLAAKKSPGERKSLIGTGIFHVCYSQLDGNRAKTSENTVAEVESKKRAELTGSTSGGLAKRKGHPEVLILDRALNGKKEGFTRDYPRLDGYW